MLRVLCALLFCSAGAYLIAVIGAAFWALTLNFSNPRIYVLFSILGGAGFAGIAGAVFCTLRKVSHRVSLPGLCFCAAVLAFFAIDEKPRAELPPLGATAEEDSLEQQVYLQMLKNAPGNITGCIPIPENKEYLFISKEPSDWAQYITDKEERILDDWKAGEVGQRWLEAMAALPPNAKIARAPSVSAPLIDFRSVRVVASHRLAYAVLLARAGNNKEAATHLQAIISAAASLQRIGHSFVDEMVAIVILNKAYAAVGQLLDKGSLDENTRARLGQTVATVLEYAAVSDRCIMADARAIIEFTDRPDHWITRVLWLKHPHRTHNTTIEFHLALQQAALARDWARADALCSEQHRKSQGIRALRNAYGNHAIDLLSAALGGEISGSLKQIAKNDDARLALLARLEQPATGDSPTPATGYWSPTTADRSPITGPPDFTSP